LLVLNNKRLAIFRYMIFMSLNEGSSKQCCWYTRTLD